MERYCRDEFINILKDSFTVIQGDVIQTSKMLKQSANSISSFHYEYEYGDFIASSIKILYQIRTKNDIITRYKNQIQIQFILEYYSDIEESEETRTITISCMPYVQNETSGIDCVSELIDIEQWYIKSITMNIIFLGEETNELYINELKVYKLATANEELIDDNYYKGIIIPLISSITEMEDKPDGSICRCAWIEGVDY